MARILIVDDEMDSREMLARLMKREGHSIAEANNGWEALLATTENQFDVILLDIMMPGLCGGKFLKIFRRGMKAGHTPVVVVTALDREMAESRLDGERVEGLIFKREKMVQDLSAAIRSIVDSSPRAGGSVN